MAPERIAVISKIDCFMKLLESETTGQLQVARSGAFGRLQGCNGSESCVAQRESRGRIVGVIQGIGRGKGKPQVDVFRQIERTGDGERYTLGSGSDDRSDGRIAEAADVVFRHGEGDCVDPRTGPLIDR